MKWFKTDLLLNFDRRALLDNARTQFKPTHVMLDCCRVNLSIRSSNSHADCHFPAKLYTAIGYTRCAHMWCIFAFMKWLSKYKYIQAGILILDPHHNIIFLLRRVGTAVGKIGRWREIPRDFSLFLYFIYTIRGSIIFQTSNLLFCRHNKYIVCMMMRVVCKAGIQKRPTSFFPPQTFFCWFQNFNKSCPALARAHFMHSLRCICARTHVSDLRQHFLSVWKSNMCFFFWQSELRMHKIQSGIVFIYSYGWETWQEKDFCI